MSLDAAARCLGSGHCGFANFEMGAAAVGPFFAARCFKACIFSSTDLGRCPVGDLGTAAAAAVGIGHPPSGGGGAAAFGGPVLCLLAFGVAPGVATFVLNADNPTLAGPGETGAAPARREDRGMGGGVALVSSFLPVERNCDKRSAAVVAEENGGGANGFGVAGLDFFPCGGVTLSSPPGRYSGTYS